MSVVLTEYLEKLGTEHTPLWIDAWDYGKAVLARGGEPPWGDVGALVAYHRQLQGLVNSDILVIELDSFYQSWLQRSPALAEAMAAKKRLGYALRTLLADTASRAHLREIVDALGRVVSRSDVAAGRAFSQILDAIDYCQAHGVNEAEVSCDDAESESNVCRGLLGNFDVAKVGVNTG